MSGLILLVPEHDRDQTLLCVGVSPGEGTRLQALAGGGDLRKAGKARPSKNRKLDSASITEVNGA